MHARVRRVVFLVFTLAFFMAAPAVVLYTSGYRINWRTGRVVQTGLISITSTPRTATVAVDGKTVGKTPIVVDAVSEGEHVVRMEKAGYYPWQRTVSVAAHKTTFLEFIPLLREEQPTFVHALNGAVTVMNEHMIVTAREEAGWVEVWTLTTEGADDRLLARIPRADIRDLAMELHPNGTLLKITRPGRATSIVETETGASFSLETSEHVWLDPEADDRIYVQKPDEPLATVMLTNPNVRIPAETAVQSIMARNSIVYTAESLADAVAITRTEANGSKTRVALLAKGTWTFAASPDDVLMLHNQYNNFVVVDAHGNDQPILLASTGTQWDWSADNKMLAWNGDGFEVNIYDTTTHTSETATRSSLEVQKLLWAPNSGYVLYTDHTGIHAIESVAQQNERATYTLVEGIPNGFTIDTRGRELRFIQSTDAETALYTRELQ